LTLTVDTSIPEGVSLLGQTLAGLQSEVTVSNDTISGELKYVTDYTGFSGAVEEQSGNYLVLHIDANSANAVITVELVGGVHGPVVLDNDRTCIFRITNKDTQSIKITAEKDGFNPDIRTYKLTGLTLDPSEP